MNIKINIVEVASDLAERELRKIYLSKLEKERGTPVTSDELDEELFEYDEESDTTYYKTKPQEMFNSLYDEFYDIVENCKVR